MSNSNIFFNAMGTPSPGYHIITYGCQMNEHESEKIAGSLENMGCHCEADKAHADIIIFNTCCVRDNAERKTFGNVGAIKHLKAKNKNMLVVVCGCMTQQKEVAKKLNKTFGFVDIVVGTHNIHELPELIINRLSGSKRIVDVWEKEGAIFEDYYAKRKSGPLASVNVMYGCNNFCSYCIVPYVRGRERSRIKDDIINEVNELCASGKKEILLLGQNVNSYGKGSDCNFSELVAEICEKTNVERIRFMTSHPKDLSDELIDVVAKYDKVCKHIHLPVQSGSTRILKEMNRGYTREEYIALVQKIRDRIPGVAITTDIIVGFPGETEEDFNDTMTLVEQIKYDAAYTFVYSVRTGTKAAEMPGHLDEATKSERIVKLVALQNSITEAVDKSYEGSVQKVLVEDISTRDTGDVCGRTDTGKMVNFKGDKSLIGEFCNVLITEGKRTTLFGKEVK